MAVARSTQLGRGRPLVFAVIKDQLRRIVPKLVWDTARQMRIRADVNRYARRVVTHQYGEATLRVLLADRLAEGWYDHDWPRLAEIGLLSASRLRPGAIAFNLGAHQAVVAMLLSHAAGEAGSVVAVEGMEHNCVVARENLRLNDVGNVHVRHAVVSDRPGAATFFEGLNGSVAEHGVGREVEAVTVDQLADEYGPPAVVFVDVEGYEHQVLRGAESTLRGDCDWFVEVHAGCGLERYGSDVSTLLDHFPAERYERYVLSLRDGDDPKPFRDADTAPRERFGLVALCRANRSGDDS